MLKKIIGISAICLCAFTATACASGAGNGTETTADASGESQGKELPMPDITEDLKADGEKKDISDLVNKYKPMVTLADYKGVKVSDKKAYEMTEEELDNELEMMLASFKKYDDVTESGTTQDGDYITLKSEATVDGKAYENFTFDGQSYQIGSEMIAEEFDKQITGKKAGEDFEISVSFPEDAYDESMLEEGEISLNGKTVQFKCNISKIERPVEEKMDDEWVKNHKDELAYYGYDGTDTVKALKEKIKETTDKNAALSILKDRGREALSYVIKDSKFSYPEDEVKVLKDQTLSNLEQEYEYYKDMIGVSTLEEYLEAAYEFKGDSAKDDYANKQAEEYLQNKMSIILIADEAGIEVGEEDLKKTGNDMAMYYGFDSYDAMVEQGGDNVKDNVLFETLFNKVMLYLGSLSDPSLETSTDETDGMILEEDAVEVLEEETSSESSGS